MRQNILDSDVIDVQYIRHVNTIETYWRWDPKTGEDTLANYARKMTRISGYYAEWDPEFAETSRKGSQLIWEEKV